MAIVASSTPYSATPVDWADITNKPNCFPPCAHGWTHAGGGTDMVPLVTATEAGLTPPPTAAANSANYYFGGDLAWHNLAAVSSQVVTTAGPGLVPTLPGTAGQYFSSASPAGYKAVDFSELTGTPTSYPTNWSLITGLPACFPPCPHGPSHGLNGADPVTIDWTQIVNAPAGYAPSPHWPSHVTGNDQIPSASASTRGLLNRLSGLAGDYVGGDNACHSLVTALLGIVVPTGSVLSFAGAAAPTGFLLCDGSAQSTSTYAALFGVLGYTFGGSGASFNLPDLRGRVSVGAGQGAGLVNRVLAAKGGEENHLLTVPELAIHGHGLNDPTHNHADPGHNHQFNDPGHAHGITQTPHNHTAAGYNSINYGTTSPGYAFFEATSSSTGTANANITINGSGTGGYNSPSGTGIKAAGTGCTVANAGSNGAHNNMQPFIVLNSIIKT